MFKKLCFKYLLVLWALVEYMRLYLAEEGNIQQNVEKIAASLWLLIFPQLPVVFYMGFLQDDQYDIEKALFGAMMLVGLLEIGFILQLLKRYTNLNKVALFRQYQNIRADDENRVIS